MMGGPAVKNYDRLSPRQFEQVYGAAKRNFFNHSWPYRCTVSRLTGKWSVGRRERCRRELERLKAMRERVRNPVPAKPRRWKPSPGACAIDRETERRDPQLHKAKRRDWFF